MSYNGTITLEDPNLLTSFDLDEQTTAYVVRDTDAEAPDWDGIGHVFRLDYDHSRYDSSYTEGDESEPVGIARGIVTGAREAWDRFRDHELVARYLRMWHDAADVDYSSTIDREGTVYAVVTRAEVEAWGCEDPAGLAGQALDVIRQWVEGDAVGIIVVNTETGEEESVWGVYGGEDYWQSTAQDIAPIGVQS